MGVTLLTFGRFDNRPSSCSKTFERGSLPLEAELQCVPGAMSARMIFE